MLTVLTPTGGRPESFAKCEAMMLAQDFTGPVLWIIVDDCIPKTSITFKRGDWNLLVIRPTPPWAPRQNTHNRNMIAGLEQCGESRVVIVEDDDYYGPTWLSMCDRWLDDHDAVGEAPTLYRHISGKERMMNNRTPSLCATAFKGAFMIDRLVRVCEERENAIDVYFWRGLVNVGVYPHSGEQIGIKGQPGRPGIGVGHELRIYS